MIAASLDPQAEILIVDDLPANLRLLSQLLTEHGYRVRAAASGGRALESVRAAPPDLILLDIRMPEMDGFTVCRELKADPRSAHVPVIFISALDEIQEKVRAFNAGGLDYITKPFQVEEVLARVETHLTLRRLQERLEIANRRFHRELDLAGKIQSSILPGEMPQISGWDFTASLRPARETCGDFYDLFVLEDGRLGLLIADVVDKGAAAALLMAVSWDSLNTCACQGVENPHQVLTQANQRLLQRLEGVIFLTVFYGILDPTSGELVYANAGHVPPLHLTRQGEIHRLIRTGMPVGVKADCAWEMKSVHLSAGDSLILYTDGVTDAEGADGDFFGETRLLSAVGELASQPLAHQAAAQIRDRLLARIEAFVQETSPYDDIALLIVHRQGD
jgi:sigma-B regulation protein RsbU (phosphoserine phosphatase)